MAVAIFQQVVNAVTDRLVTAFPTRAIYNRRKPVVLEDDRIPCIVVSPSSDGERIVLETFGGNVVYGYPVNVLLVSPGNEIATLRHPADTEEEADLETFDHMEARELIRNTVYKTGLTGVASVFNGEIAMGRPFTITGGGQSLYMVSAVTVTHWSLETQVW